ncbi:hypothetical protein BDV93DRAFT_515066 [Ceratobasidium sp. AG-I]|nr:hypothetical protein BDV93DRAFT_515066 [Ceratobasidium sp. AG-I]
MASVLLDLSYGGLDTTTLCRVFFRNLSLDMQVTQAASRRKLNPARASNRLPSSQCKTIAPHKVPLTELSARWKHTFDCGHEDVLNGNTETREQDKKAASFGESQATTTFTCQKQVTYGMAKEKARSRREFVYGYIPEGYTSQHEELAMSAKLTAPGRATSITKGKHWSATTRHKDNQTGQKVQFHHSESVQDKPK